MIIFSLPTCVGNDDDEQNYITNVEMPNKDKWGTRDVMCLGLFHLSFLVNNIVTIHFLFTMTFAMI